MSGSASPATPTCAGSCSTKASRGTPCGKTTRWSGSSRSTTGRTGFALLTAPLQQQFAGGGEARPSGPAHGAFASGDARDHPHRRRAGREVVRKAEVGIGYLHRGFEKECEAGTYTKVFPYTDRLNYCSPLLNNVAYALAVEKLFGVEVPPGPSTSACWSASSAADRSSDLRGGERDGARRLHRLLLLHARPDNSTS